MEAVDLSVLYNIIMSTVKLITGPGINYGMPGKAFDDSIDEKEAIQKWILKKKFQDEAVI